MRANDPQERAHLRRMDRRALAERQLAKLNQLLATILPANRFYAGRLAATGLPLASLEDLATLPFTYKDELVGRDATRNFAAHHTWPRERYTRLHQTSGTRGRPLILLDTAEDWQWWLDGWQFVLDAAGIQPGDRVLLAFSFGPFIGFWSAFEAAAARGCLVVPCGGMSTLGRIEMLRSVEATAVFCTPSYALHLAEAAAAHKIPLAGGSLRQVIVAGEPGGSVPATRARIEQAFGAQVVDHAGATEVGPWGFGDEQGRGLYINEAEFIAEFISVQTGQTANDGELAELVLTGLGRFGCPMIRYRTRDLVRPRWEHDGECRFVRLEGGVLGRTDDMLIIRGVNIYPSAIDQIMHGFPEVVEYRALAGRDKQLDTLRIEVEDHLHRPERIAEELKARLGLSIEVSCVPLGSLPRSDGKGQRFIDQRSPREGA